MPEILIGQCGKIQEGQIHINKKSDFPLSLKLVKDGKPTKWYDCDFDIKASVEGGFSVFTAGRKGGNFNHCKVENDSSLTVFFDNHNLTAGQLQIEVIFYHVDKDYNTDGIRQEAFNVASNVYLVNDNGNAVSLEMPAPQIIEKEVIKEVEKPLSELEQSILDIAKRCLKDEDNEGRLIDEENISLFKGGMYALRTFQNLPTSAINSASTEDRKNYLDFFKKATAEYPFVNLSLYVQREDEAPLEFSTGYNVKSILIDDCEFNEIRLDCISAEVIADRDLRMFQKSDIKRLVLSGGSVLQTLKNFEAFDFVREVVFDGTVLPLPTALEILHALPNNRGWHRHSSTDPEINPVLRFKNIAGMSHDILSHFADKGYTDVALIEGEFDESAVYVAEQANNSDNSNALQTLLSGVENTGLTEQVLKGMIVEKKYESNENIFNSPFEEGEKEALIEYRKYLALNPKYSREGLFERLTADNLEVVLSGQGFAKMFTNANIKHLTLSFKGSAKRLSNIFYYTNGETLEIKIDTARHRDYDLEELFVDAVGIGEQFGTNLKKLIVTICKDEKTPFAQGEFERTGHYYGFRNGTFKYWELLSSLKGGTGNLAGKIEFDTNVILSPEGWNKIQELGFVISESKKYNGPAMEDFSL
nr:MAG TPA: hypothetical protein [Caudoviricetes sp.]